MQTTNSWITSRTTKPYNALLYQ